jgi:hypothetical protein
MQKMRPRGKKCHTLWKPRNKSMVFPGRGLEDTDPTPVEEISWSKVVHGPRRPFTCWTEDQFVLTTSSGIRYQGVAKIVVRGSRVLVNEGSRTLVTEGGETSVSWTHHGG